LVGIIVWRECGCSSRVTLNITETAIMSGPPTK
jgi:hypothetical protein